MTTTPTMEQLQAENEKLKEELKDKTTFINNCFEAITHPFYVVDINDYSVIMANSASYLSGFHQGTTCHEMTHNSVVPCKGKHPCPIDAVKESGKPVTMIHNHFIEGKGERVVQVNGYPIYEDGVITSMIEYSIDITDKFVKEP